MLSPFAPILSEAKDLFLFAPRDEVGQECGSF